MSATRRFAAIVALLLPSVALSAQDLTTQAETPPVQVAIAGTVDVTTFAHIDPVLARDEADNPVPGRIEAFLDAHAVAGALAIPRVDSEASAP